MRCGEHGQTRLKSAVPCIFPMESQKPRATRVVETIPKDGDRRKLLLLYRQLSTRNRN